MEIPEETLEGVRIGQIQEHLIGGKPVRDYQFAENPLRSEELDVKSLNE